MFSSYILSRVIIGLLS